MASALVVSPEAFYPMAGGGAVRTASIVEYLLSRGYAVDLVLFGIEGGWDPRKALPADRLGDVLLLTLPPHSKGAAARMARNTVRLIRNVPPLIDRFAGFEPLLEPWLAGRKYDIAVLEHFWSAQYGRIVRPHARTLVLDLHNVESSWHQRLAATEPWPVCWGHHSFAAACRRLEQKLLPPFDRVLAPSESDIDKLGIDKLGIPAVVYPNSVPTIPLPRTEKLAQTIVFSGNLEYHPNIQAVRWFLRRVWPLIRQRRPDVQWRIVGRNEHAIAGEMGAGMEVTGAVDDAIAEISRGQLAIVPVLSGSGTRVKILEAWAAGLPVVSTTLGAEGLHGSNGEHLLLADTPEAFASCVERLLEDAGLREQVGGAGRSLYEKRYTWEAAWQLLDAALGFQ